MDDLLGPTRVTRRPAGQQVIQMDSMQAVLSPSMTPGWNDPPNLGVASNRLAQLRRRPVDPSLSGVSPGGNIAPQITGNVRGHEGHQYHGVYGDG
ncbi:unnamed protein product [Angiostrongylus costaricensis]|uniref:Conserved domain protein n=1 Tax=Angiostrongylus costaricensis TaxID=334426 RepID=A0A0R3PLP9_ANGCS|nr:unnamed protein product [Angiostrongylus costaricensis]